jgi:hypothetical protein
MCAHLRALPLLSYTLDDMWTQMTRRGQGKLRLPTQSFELGGVLVNRANNFLAQRAEQVCSSPACTC